MRRRPHGARIGAAIIGAVIVAQIAIAAIAIARDDAEVGPVAPIIPTAEITEPLALEAAAALGTEVAREWRNDAVLVRAGMQIDWPDDMVDELPTELPQGGWAILGLLSGNDLLTLRMDRGSGVVVETELQRLSDADAAHLASHAIDFEQASSNSTTAILASEIAYGQSHRAACPERRRATWISVIHDEDSGESSWFVRYRDNANPETITLSMQIDWTTGAMVDVVNTDPDCAEEPA